MWQMNYRFLDEAESEFVEHVGYYENHEVGEEDRGVAAMKLDTVLSVKRYGSARVADSSHRHHHPPLSPNRISPPPSVPDSSYPLLSWIRNVSLLPATTVTVNVNPAVLLTVQVPLNTA